MKIIYSFWKTGFEERYWTAEIGRASSREYQFIPFNHGGRIDPERIARAQLLDNMYFAGDAALRSLYSDLEERIQAERAHVLLVDNYCPYHPDYLRTLKMYKVLRIADGPMSAYDRDFAYLHAFDHVLYHSPAYSRDMQMPDKLRYCGAKRVDFWPLGSFDTLCDPKKTEEELMTQRRDIDVVFVGALHVNKMPVLSAARRALGRRLRLHGIASLKKNVYFNLRFGCPGWVRRLPFEEYVSLYQKAKIGINVHNRGDYTVGGYRLFDLPANGVMQISDGGPFLNAFFEVGREVESYGSADELIEKVRYFLNHEDERRAIALNGLRRVRRDYRIGSLLERAGRMIEEGMRAQRAAASALR